MASTFQLTIVSATGKVFSGAADAVSLSGADGSFGILASHTPLIAALVTGLTKVTTEAGERYFMTGEGYVEVAHNEAAVIVGEAVEVKDRESGAKFLSEQDPWEAAAAAMEANT